MTREDGLVLWASGGTDGMWVAFSPDGIHWTNYEEKIRILFRNRRA